MAAGRGEVGKLLFVLLAFAAELLELGEHGADVEIAARLLLGLRGGDFRLLARGGLDVGAVFAKLKQLGGKGEKDDE